VAILLFSYAVAQEVIEDETNVDIEAAYFNPMMGGMGMMNPMMQMQMNQMMMDPMMQMQMGGMNPMMMDPMMQMGGMNPMMGGMDPSMMEQMMQMGMNPMMMGMNPMHSMFSGKVDEAPEADADSAQMMMMPMGGACGSTCACRQQCRMVWW